MAGIKFGSWLPNCHCKRIGGFKLGDSVQDRHTYFGRFLIWRLLERTAKPPNLIPRQIFRLYDLVVGSKMGSTFNFVVFVLCSLSAIVIAHCHSQIFVGVVTYISAYHLLSACYLSTYHYKRMHLLTRFYGMLYNALLVSLSF